MLYTVDTIREDVRKVLDQNTTATSLSDMDTSDTLTIDAIINTQIEPGVLAVAMSANLLLFDNTTLKTVTSTTGKIWVDGDFLRLCYIKGSDWKRGVTVAITPEDPKYSQMFSDHAGVAGTKENPMVAISVQHNGTSSQPVLEVSPSVGSYNLTYIKRPKISENKIDISTKLYGATLHYIAYLVASVLQESNAALYKQIATELMA